MTGTLVHATCVDCGDIQVTTAEVTVRVCIAPRHPAAYVLRCPRCAGIVTRPVPVRVANLLVCYGAAFQLWAPPAELAEPHEGPPISHDDLIDFHRALQGDTWGVA